MWTWKVSSVEFIQEEIEHIPLGRRLVSHIHVLKSVDPDDLLPKKRFKLFQELIGLFKLGLCVTEYVLCWHVGIRLSEVDGQRGRVFSS